MILGQDHFIITGREQSIGLMLEPQRDWALGLNYMQITTYPENKAGLTFTARGYRLGSELLPSFLASMQEAVETPERPGLVALKLDPEQAEVLQGIWEDHRKIAELALKQSLVA